MPDALPLGFVERTVHSGAVRLRCVSAGPPDGALVVLLHGFPARWATWRGVMPLLAAAGFHVVAPDLRGYGESDRPPRVEDYSVRRIVDDVAAIIRDFGHEKAFIVGHDFGGGVAWATAMFRPELVRRLAVLNSVHVVGFERAMRRFSQLVKSWYVFFFLLPWLPEWLLARRDFQFMRRSLAEDGLGPDVIADLLEGVRPPGALHAAIDWYRASFRDGVRKRLAPVKVELPVLVIWGDRERHLVPELADPPAEWVKDARVAHVAGGSHWVHHDAPEEVARLLVEHLRGPESPSG